MTNYSKPLGALLAASAVGVGLVFGVGSAVAAPKAGHLVLDVNGVETVLPPGQAKKAAAAACDDAVVVDIDAVRAAFPAPVEVCEGVTLTSQVAADADDEVEAE